MQIVDPYLASYGAANPIFAVIQLAQTTMRSELGKMTLDKTFEERDALNENIVVCHLISNLKLFVYFPYDHIIAISMVKLHMSYVVERAIGYLHIQTVLENRYEAHRSWKDDVKRTYETHGNRLFMCLLFSAIFPARGLSMRQQQIGA